MSWLKTIVLLTLLVGLAQGQVLKELRERHAAKKNRSENHEEDSENDGFFAALLKRRSERERTSYSIQRDWYFKNKTHNNIIIKLKNSDKDDSKEGGFFSPFFEWAKDKKRASFQKRGEIRKKGWKRIDEKLAKWNISGIVQTFYGSQTGISVLNVNHTIGSILKAWAMVLSDNDVEFAEIDMDVKTFGCNLATDWGSVLIRAQKAAEVLGLSSLNSTSDAKVLIGVIDSGIDYEHPLLRDKIWVNTEELNGVEGVDDDGNGYVDDIWGWNFASNTNDVRDEDGHGTHVSGIIAAETSTNPEFSGVAPNVMILPCRFTDTSDSGSVSSAIQCIEFCLDNGVDIISNSWGGMGANSMALEEAMQRANQRGTLQVIAAGNTGSDNDGPAEMATYPAAFDTEIILSVAAIGSDGSLSSVSNFGKITTDIGAPGVSILSTTRGGDFIKMSGTSQATPFVTAASALLMGACRIQNRECSAFEIKKALIDGAEPSRDLQGRLVSSGFLDIPNAARELGLTGFNDRGSLDLCESAAFRMSPSFVFLFICIVLCYVFV